MQFGLTTKDLEVILQVIQQYPEVNKAILFGSRAKGTHKQGSDVDLALRGSSLTPEIISSISFQLNEETTLPYFFDVLHYEHLRDTDLIAHIDRVGQCLFQHQS